MSLKDYLLDKFISLFILICLLLVLVIFLWELKLEWYHILIVHSSILIAVILSLTFDFIAKRQYYQRLLTTFEQLEEKSYLTEVMTPPLFYDGQLLYRLLKKTNKYANDMLAKHQSEIQEYKDYIETWIHEVKTPIATTRLLIENNKNITTLSIEEEINKVDFYIEQVLYYVKIGSVEKDYHIRTVSVREMVIKEIKKQAKAMINEGCRPILKELDYEVLTDPKWSEFMIGQLIANAIKYKAKNPIIEFDAKTIGNHLYLSIKDNGIGIDEKDLNRVFQKGFTGENGRLTSKSTGIGLYLCRQLCEKMGTQLTIESELGVGTTVTLIFSNITKV